MEHDKKENLIIRADASTSMGTGHLMRCLALGQAWKDDGGQVTFITACRNESLLQRLRKEDFTLHLLDTPHPDDSDWRHTSNILLSHPGSWVTLDGYHFDEAYQQKVKDTGLRLLIIDDTAHQGHYYADILLNQNLDAEKLPYSCESCTRLLLGTRYTLLRREFLTGRYPERQIGQTARKVLVTLGGSDPGNYTMKVIQGLYKVSLSGSDAAAIVDTSNPHSAVAIVGASYTHADELEATINKGQIPVRIVRDAQNMLELMTWADAAVSSGGVTIWELAFMGVPTILVIQMENQRIAAEALHHAGAALNLGWANKIGNKELSTELEKFLRDKRKRQEMSRRLQTLVDGEGLSRLIMHIKGEKLRLRRVRMEDCKLLWEWANDPVVRATAFSSEPIPWEEHVRWFAQKLNDSRCFHFIALDEHDISIGQIRFDIQGEGAEVDVSIDRRKRGSAYGYATIKASVERMFLLSQVKVIHSHVKPNNKASVNVFRKAGFQELELEVKQGQPAMHFTRVRGDG